jgi:hypothetical protein
VADQPRFRLYYGAEVSTGEQVKAAWIFLGWPQYDLAGEARVSAVAVHAYENGGRISDGRVLSLQEALEEYWRSNPTGA